MPLVVIVPTRNRPDLVARVVRDVLAELARDPDVATEVVLVDQSDDPIRARNAALAGPRVRHLPCPAEGLPHGRNVGLTVADAPVTLFLDDDVHVLPGCLRAHLDVYAEAGVGGVVGRIAERSVRPNALETVNQIGIGGRVHTNLWGTTRGPVATLKGANMSFRTEVLRQIGGFDRNYGGTFFLEDADASVRVAKAGFTLMFEPTAEVVHDSAPVGGVRVEDARRTAWWRFHNTGYFVRRHRPARHLPRVVATFAGVATRRAVELGDPTVVPFLLDALRKGWHLGARSPALSVE